MKTQLYHLLMFLAFILILPSCGKDDPVIDNEEEDIWRPGKDDEEEQDWAAQAMMRANRTASTYNNYILENEYVWADNVPNDIYMELPYLT